MSRAGATQALTSACPEIYERLRTRHKKHLRIVVAPCEFLRMIRSLLFFLLLGTTAASAQQTSPPVATSSGVQSAAQVGQAAPPRCDENCVKNNLSRASELCAPKIEAKAPSDFDWLSRPNSGIFQQADPSSPTDAVVRYRGDSVRFMDASKTWVRVTYECGFDVDSQKVAFVNARAGRLDQANVPVQPQAANPAPQTQTAANTPPQAAPAAAKPKPRVWEPSRVEIQQQAPNPKRP